ncbi:MAG TPA: type I secretion C-terminal target domain-containing protein [Acetobacteraceae bacterium]|nr:type I secretion C-terminal target domain-containing protein [Acetobacteraceae bacterium]
MSETTAIAASSVVDSIGINTHIDFDSYGYQNLPAVEEAINYLGVKNIRDSAENPSDVQSWLQVSQATGARFDDFIGETSPSDMQTQLALMPQLAAEGVLNYIEGGNEEDDSYAASQGNNLQTAAQFQQQVFAMGQQLGLPVINMSFGAGWTGANDWQGDYGTVGDLSAYTNFANAHTYPNAGTSVDSTIQQLNGDALLAAGNRPVITTEIGWDTGGQGAAVQGVVEAALDGIKDGDAGMYFYALFNDGSGNYGLMNSDGSPTPAGTALHDLTTLLADDGGSFTPGSLDYSLNGNVSSDNTLLMAKSDGSYWLALWDESAGAHNVTVNLGSDASQIQVFDPVTGTSAIQSASNANSMTVDLGGDPLLVEVVPSGSSSAAATAAAGSSNAGAATSSDNSSDTTTPAATSSSNAAGGAQDSSATATTAPAITIASGDTNPVENVSNTTIGATAGDHLIFIGGTGDTLTATGGNETVQAFQGSNTIATGSGDDAVYFAGSNNVVDAGGGSNTLYDSGSNNTIMLPAATQGSDTIYGYLMTNGDTFDMSKLLAGTSWNGDVSTIGDFVSLTDANNNAVISVDPSGTQGGSSYTVATLESTGPVTLGTLLAHAIT